MSNNSNSTPAAPTSFIDWFEIPVSNVPKALALYAAMLDTTLVAVESGSTGHETVVLGSSGALIGTAKGKVPAGGTVVYLNARDGVKAALARAVEAGARVVLGETSIGPNGTIAKIEDLDGNIVGLHAELAK